MESLNPFWYTVLLISMCVGPICAVLTLIAGAVWLFLRSKVPMVIALFLLSCTVAAAITFVIAMFLAERR